VPTAESGGAGVRAPGNLAARIGAVRVAAAEVRQDIIVVCHVGPHRRRARLPGASWIDRHRTGAAVAEIS